MKYLHKALGAALALALSVSLAFAGGLPFVPANPNFSDPSQIVPTLNSLINTLNGNAGGITTGSPGVVSLGSFGTNGAGGGTPQVVNAQRGQVTFTGVASLATGATATLVLTNSVVTAASICQAWEISAGTAGSAVYVATVVASAGSLSIVVANGGTTTDAVTTHVLGFNCVQ